MPARGFLIEGSIDERDVEQLGRRLLVDTVVEDLVIGKPGSDRFHRSNAETDRLFHVLPKPGVTDPEAETALMAARQLGYDIDAVRTFRRYCVSSLPAALATRLFRMLANDSIEQLIEGPILIDQIHLGQPYRFELNTVRLRNANDQDLLQISREWQLSLTLVEMQTIQAHFRTLDRDPTDAELETVAQTWSEHCSHKTLAGRIEYTDENGTRHFENMLKETIFAATHQIRDALGEDDWCISVFQDNAGIVRFDEQHHLTFKVETHNRPSAIEPYGGANTGIGGVIRDTLGTGLGAKPVCNTDVFCFASPDTPEEDLPGGVLHPRRVMKGVVAGVRDYGNRMGIPTVNGAVYFDPRYIGNPLVFCGSVGLLPADKAFKRPQPDDLIVAIGGRTGRDGIHGATFSSAELTDQSEITSGGAVQIGNAIVQKMMMDVLLTARDEGLYNAVTDCGAGGFSSAVGEMGEEIGAEVWLDQAPLKYAGLSYTEIWISEAQERMILAVPEGNWSRFQEVCNAESVEATVIGRYVPTGRLTLKYGDQTVADLSMEFLHDGRPPVVRKAVHVSHTLSANDAVIRETLHNRQAARLTQDLLSILGSLNVASKHWIIRQYDHEVQGGSVIKPLVGKTADGPSDAAVLRPVLTSRRGLVVSCGMNPYFGDLDPYYMAASAIDEAIRNCVATGADPRRIAILDNFCWGYTDRPETLGSLVRAAIACHDMAVAFQTPFISGKDSLNNEFSYTTENGERRTISIPATLLISALGQVDDISHCISMDLKQPGNLIYLVGRTRDEMGGSHWTLVSGLKGGQVPVVEPALHRRRYEKLHAAISAGLVRACHDLSEGGLAVAAAEMAFAGSLGVTLDIQPVGRDDELIPGVALFSESNGRFLCEVKSDSQLQFESQLGDECQLLGTVNDTDKLLFTLGDQTLIHAGLDLLKTAWHQPLDWK